MLPNYADEFPIPKELIPKRLAALLEPVGLSHDEMVEISARFSHDFYGKERECLHLLMAVIPAGQENNLHVLNNNSGGVVSYSVPVDDIKGCCTEYQPSVSDFDYIVASRGDGSFYSYILAEKVWMMLGLTPRCVGGESQRIIFDDLELPEFGVAEGEVSNEFYFKPNRNISWKMSNEYLRKYLWMRNSFGARVFFYETLLDDSPKIRELMDDTKHVVLKQKNGWYKIDIREFNGWLLLQCWATVVDIPPERCDIPTIDGLYWPDIDDLVTQGKADADIGTMVYLDDRFLERYEQNGFYSSTPILAHEQWLCSPSYKGQWAFTGCTRVGRNLIRVELRDLYKAIPAREVLHARKYALSLAQISHLDKDAEHIASKTQRLLDQMLIFGENLTRLGTAIDIQFTSEEISGFSKDRLGYSGWDTYPELGRLAQVAPVDMSQQAFLSRCKNLHEIWQRIPNGVLKQFLRKSGCPNSDVKGLGSLKLLQSLLNVLQRLNADKETLESFTSSDEPENWNSTNMMLAPLFINNDLRIADAHEKAEEVISSLETLGVDTASLNSGYGQALDYVFDGVISSFSEINDELDQLFCR